MTTMQRLFVNTAVGLFETARAVGIFLLIVQVTT